MAGWWNGGNYGADQDWYNTDVIKLDPSLAGPNWGEYERFLTNAGFGGNDNKSMWGRGQFNRADAGYKAAYQSNPGLTFRDYIDQLGPGWLDQQFASLSPTQQGYQAPGQTRVIRR